MKKAFLSFVMAVTGLLSAHQAYAGCFTCTPVTTNCTGPFGAACPGSLPDATVGTNYNETVSFYLPASVDTTLPIIGALTIPVDTAFFLGATGLPDGMFFALNNCEAGIYFPEPNDLASQFSCGVVYGSPCGGSQTITFNLNFNYAVTTPFGAFQVPQSFPVTFELVSNVPVLEVTSDLDFLCASGAGSSATLTASTGFSSYEWSTGGTASDITVSGADTYTVTATDASSGCTQEAEYVISRLSASVSGGTFTICPNQILPLSASGGATFLWTPAANLSEDDVANPVVYDLTANQTFTVTVSNGFCDDDATVTVNISTSCSSDCTPATPNRSFTPPAGAIAASSPTSLPNMTGGVAYNTDVTFFFKGAIPLDDILVLALGTSLPGLPQIDVAPDFVTVSDVTGLPSGLLWSCDQLDVSGNGCTYFPALAPAITQYGAISFCGTPCGVSGTDTVKIILTATATLPAAVPFIGGSQQSFDIELPLVFTLSNTNELLVSASLTGVQPAGTPVTLTASTTGFSNFSWSNGATTSSITVNVGGPYTVNAFDGACTQSATYTVEYTSGIENINAASLNIFPNPNNGAFDIAFDLKKAASATISVLNVQGKEVYTENFAATTGKNNKNVSLNNLSSGIYIVKLNVEGNAVSRRITLF
jgi:hypothetical protein